MGLWGRRGTTTSGVAGRLGNCSCGTLGSWCFLSGFEEGAFIEGSFFCLPLP